ncbi:hypothetical protein LXA43DRAFT_710125 [Ganoderma leucocontextum]|nr:hypothetical protein LXA43DRAFT_710125 [Ganoderma leucocontextum]
MSGKPKQIQDVTSATDTEPGVPRVLTWPVPHIIVSYRETTYAFGRKAVVELGYEGFMKELFRTLVWKHLSYDLNRVFNGSLFKRNALLFGVFRTILGEHDVGPVVLRQLGWVVMVENVISMELVYDETYAK